MLTNDAEQRATRLIRPFLNKCSHIWMASVLTVFVGIWPLVAAAQDDVDHLEGPDAGVELTEDAGDDDVGSTDSTEDDGVSSEVGPDDHVPIESPIDQTDSDEQPSLLLDPKQELLFDLGRRIREARQEGEALGSHVRSIAAVAVPADPPFDLSVLQTGHVDPDAAELVSLAVADLEDLDAVQRRLGELEMLDDNLVSIPTNKFLTDSVASGNAGALHMMVVIDFLIAIDSDFATAKDLAYRATVTSKYVYLDKPVVVLLSDEVTEAGYATKVRIKAYVIDTRYEKRFVSDVTERVKRTYREAEITPPFLAYRREVS